MNLTIHQTITINKLRVGSVNNSSIIQIGSAGMVRASSQLYNTGGYTEPAPDVPIAGEIATEGTLVPLAPLT
ncbi:spore germination protein GerPB [Sediminibacillus massiliensis]|uniref:spore germination protein GerPB n=1 Tax=Sediminibacillus massiliensis TaxID=1926277 RepID=UPI0009885DF7|nr:spore germination protein GerPB [Sediminibacillus massiliensis]